MFLVSTPVRGHARVDIFGVGGGVRWGNSVLFNFNYIVRSPALPHIRHATLLDVLLHFHTYVMLRCWTFSCTSTHTSCHAAGRSLALPHIHHATLLGVLLHFHTYVMLRCWTFSCTSTHRSCYAAGRSLALPHISHTTLLDVLLHFHTYVMLRCWTFSCTSTHTSCYAAGRSLTFSCMLCLKQNRNFSTKLSGHKITLSLWQNTRFSNFEATLPWNFNSKFTEEK